MRNRTTAIALVALGVLAGPVVAAPRDQCTGDPFLFPEIQTTRAAGEDDRFSVAWRADASTWVTCQERDLEIDVWEHALVRIARSGSSPAARMAGRVRLRVDIPQGGTVLLGGRIRGRGSCVGGLCVLESEVRARGSGSVRLRMVERVTIDVVAHEVIDIEVLTMALEARISDWNPSDIDGDGIPNEEDPDRDGDGLLNDEEPDYATDPDNPDTDFGGLSDGVEVFEGLDPLDPMDDVSGPGAGQCC